MSIYYLFSKSGYTKACHDKAREMGNVTLVTFEDIMRKKCQSKNINKSLNLRVNLKYNLNKPYNLVFFLDIRGLFL